MKKPDFLKALPNLSAKLSFDILEGDVTIYRDDYGIPHVRASSVHDVFFGQGFATAQDRLWQMDYDRKTAYGQCAEYLGRIILDQDIQMRRFQIGVSVQRDYECLNGQPKIMLDAYSAGVNAFIASTQTLPIEYTLLQSNPENWNPWDCLAVFKVRHIMMGVFESKLWRSQLVNVLGAEQAAQLVRGYQNNHLLIVPPGASYPGSVFDGFSELNEGLKHLKWMRDSEQGSNSWVLSGKRTLSGKPLMAGDPHRGLDVPNVYYQNHIQCPDFDVIGLSFPGYPGFPHFGHNTHVAWCVTHANADYQDLFIEQFSPADPSQYRYMGEWLPTISQPETINIAGEASLQIQVAATHHGPIIAGKIEEGHGIAFKYTALASPNSGSNSVFKMLLSRSVNELDESMREWVDPCNNFLMADTNGDIAYLTRGQIPIRSLANAWLPVPGWNGEHEWEGFIPHEHLPRIMNPESNMIVTANNRIIDNEYPYYIALDFAPEYRARRISERLEKLDKATVDDMESVHTEHVSIPGRVFAELFKSIQPIDEYSILAMRQLEGWHGDMNADGVAPTIYSAFRKRFNHKLIGALLGGLAPQAFQGSGRGAPGHIGQLSSNLVTELAAGMKSNPVNRLEWQRIGLETLAEAIKDLRGTLGDDMGSWTWGSVHFTQPHHPLSQRFPDLSYILDPPSIPMNGDGDTPQAASYSVANSFVVTSTSVARYVFDLSNWNNSRWISPLGASGHPGSGHYADQCKVWGQGSLIPMCYQWDRIIDNAVSSQKLHAK